MLTLARKYRKWILGLIFALLVVWALISPPVYFGLSHYTESGTYWAGLIILIALFLLVYVLFFTDMTKLFLKKSK
jgi:multisubunit Na+/H+ antiporter MnhE subunit